METTMEPKSQVLTKERPGHWLSGMLPFLHSLGLWREKQAMAAAFTSDRGSRQAKPRSNAAVGVGIAAPVPIDILKARGAALQTRLDAARALLRAHEP
jgi:hypothetical protein